jgi:flagellar biosynthesis GTPase FlhF
MELKRILARDARAANEKAVAQFGPDVLIISSSQVNGLTELIVAVDLSPLTPEDAEPFIKTRPRSLISHAVTLTRRLLEMQPC